MKGRKQKGANGEREVAKILSDRFGVSVERNLEQTRGGGHDLLGMEKHNIAIEVKRQERLNIDSWWDQTLRQAELVSKRPVLIYRRNYMPWVVRIDLKDFVTINRSILADISLNDFMDLLEDETKPLRRRKK